MDEMLEPKSFIKSILDEIEFDELETPLNVTVYLERPSVIVQFPSITFSILSNVPDYDLGNSINYQDIIIKLDIWADDSPTTGAILKLVENKMRENNYRLTFNSDRMDVSGKYHLTTRFTY
jgi:hypothetical protein